MSRFLIKCSGPRRHTVRIPLAIQQIARPTFRNSHCDSHWNLPRTISGDSTIGVRVMVVTEDTNDHSL
jgi:hypothetical protein